MRAAHSGAFASSPKVAARRARVERSRELAMDQEVLTDSLWVLGARDKSGVHMGDYHGNFVPQIPRQLIRRFTNPGDVVLDAFLGSGTTLIECRRLGRHGIGIELLPRVANASEARIDAERAQGGATTRVLRGDSSTAEAEGAVRRSLARLNRANADLAVLHPPYHDIIRFSDDPRDLSTCADVKGFLERFERVLERAAGLVRPGGHVAIVIGDLYRDSEVVPLGFQCMNLPAARALRLKGIIVKDIVNNRAKRHMENLWRYRAVAGGFYIFKHEYVFVFRKP
jgi:SAM-dependent methyltransferase